ncbi:Ig-like protein [Leptospira langatensis]|uniref:Ig-like protein n=1 Tax=Leptospira langatensis TaxID=2484983 RepID=A0A5F1ZY75_9LEPT|nr:Ig-like domain-containing protein [Leptospira langatensis]TGK00112.1 Ig-like protein [Leptospira langatensis]TGL42746.1 Ig-like protein [Leptospira langatensis]
MKNLLRSLLAIFVMFATLIGCGGTKGGSLTDSIFASLGIAVGGGGTMPTSGSIAPYQDTDQPAVLPVDFGTAGPQALLNLASLTQVDRYKSLEIVFSEPMTQSTVNSDFVLQEQTGPSTFASLPGPASQKGGVFYWKSGGRLVFDPYRELKPNTTYQLTLTGASQALEGGNLQPYTVQFTTEPDYLVSASLNGTAIGPANGTKDLTYSDATPGTIAMNLTASFANPVSGANQIQSIKLKHLNSTQEYVICAASPCDMTAPLASSLNLNSFSGTTAGLKPYQGGNAYWFEIKTANGKVFTRSFGFNYGKVNTNPYGLVTSAAAAVFDQAQTLNLFAKILEKFVHADYKINSKTFNDYAGTPTTSSVTPLNDPNGDGNTSDRRCIDFWSITANDFPITVNYIQSYGDMTGQYGNGYCGAAGNPGAFSIVASFAGDLPMYLDTYLTSVSVPSLAPDSTSNITDSIYVQADGVLGIDLNGKRAVVGLVPVGYSHDCTGLACLLGNGDTYAFSTTATLNNSAPYTSRLARAKSTATFDSSGNIAININTPYTPSDSITGNFYVSEWTNNLTVAGVTLLAATDTLGSWLSPITESVANNAVPQATPYITQSMLRDFIQRISVAAMNAVLVSLNNPGLDITLPDYLPAPLSSFPLSLRLMAQNDAVVKSDGTNKGILTSASVSLVAKTPLASSDPNYHGHQLATGFVSTKPAAAATPPKSYAFANSNANPGLLLTLNADTVTQAAYSLWQNGALNLRINKAFINTIEAYAGSDPLFQLTQQLVQVGTLLNILAPGRSTLVGLNPSDPTKLVTNVSSTDEVDIDVYAIHAPNGEFKFVGSAAQLPTLVVNFTDLELRIYGRRPNGTQIGYPVLSSLTCSSAAADSAANSCRYLLNTVRVSIKGDGSFNFIPFVNPDPTNKPQYNNLNALSLVIKKDEASMSYTLDILEGSQYNPFGLDPNGIFQVVDPLIRSLIIPLVNNVLRQVPLPQNLPLAAITHPTNGTPCVLSSTTDKLKLITIPVPTSQPYPYLFGGLQFQGAAASNPGSAISCP